MTVVFDPMNWASSSAATVVVMLLPEKSLRVCAFRYKNKVSLLPK